MTNNHAQPLTAKELSVFCAQISWLLKAAISLEEGIAAICDTTESAAQKEQMQALSAHIAETGSLTAALKRMDIFPPYLIHMMEIGELSGKLDEVADSLSDHYRREAQLQAQLKNAVISPLFLILMIAAVIAVLIAKILPIFYQVFDSLGADLPDGSVTAIGFSMALGKASLCFVLTLAVLIVVLLALSRTAQGKNQLLQLGAALPVTGVIIQKIDAARFSSVFSMLLHSGYDSVQALERMPGILSSRRSAEKATRISAAVTQGTALPQALRDSGLFSGIYTSMIGVGEKTGSLDSVMKQIAEDYSEEARNRIDNAIALIEPVMVGMLSIVIGSILLSIMLPLMGIMSSIG